jgi:2-dehydro-3-deoxyphosphogluconate aldolase/(4S)-4-hydroxy-2-oxoglutarate aldolase
MTVADFDIAPPSRTPAAAPHSNLLYEQRTREVIVLLEHTGIVPVATIHDATCIERVLRALSSGGIGCIEIAFHTPAAEEALLRARAMEGFLVGAGMVLTVEQVVAAAEAGADFAVAPGLDEDVVETAREIGLPFFPGVATPSEIDRARRLGMTTVTVFRAAELGGPAFLRGVSAAFPGVGFLPTGGVDAKTLGSYLAVASVVACAGSWLVRRELIAGGRFEEIARLAREANEVLA